MKLEQNQFKHLLRQRQLQIGLFSGLGNAISAEILATCDYDFLLIDAEHGNNDVRSVQAQLQAAAGYRTQCLVRPASHDKALIKQLLGTGVQTLLVPMVDDAAQARALVAAMHFPPHGVRGVGTALERGARWNAIPDYFEQVAQQTCLIVQIESAAGLRNLEEIAQVDGVDGIFLGPADLAAALGHLGQPGHPEVQAAIEQALRRIVACGKPAGVYSSSPSLATTYQGHGATFLAIGADTSLLRSSAINLLNQVRPAATAVGAGY
ncbi:MAG: HpcH/HpaI aldolase/citrate lyase family protein [Pseudomonadota bacterium]